MRALQGDPAAFEELVDRHRSSVYRAALAARRSPAGAEDTAQEAFLLAWRRLDTFRGQASFKTWLLTITWHQAINRRRSLSQIWRFVAQPRSEEEADAAMATAAGAGPTPEQTVAGTQLRRGIREAIRALSPKLRDALLLAQAGDYTYDDRRDLNAPLGTIGGAFEARRVVEHLQAHGYDDEDADEE